MLVCDFRSNPDDCYRIEPGSIGDQLPKVGVIRPLKLVLNQNPAIIACVLAKNIRTKRTDIDFNGLTLQFDRKRFPQKQNVFIPCQPWREVLRLAAPNVAKFDFSQPAKIAHTITPTAARPRSARRFRANRSMQAMRTATPISTCS